MRLYEISADYVRLQEMLDSADTPEEMRQTIIDTMESVQGDFEDKAENMAALVTDNKAAIAGCKAEIKRLQDKMSRLENQNESIQRYLMAEMQFIGQRKVQAGTWTISIQKNGGKAPLVWKVEPDALDLQALPEKYVKRTEAIDTSAVRETLEAGGFLSFAELGERGESLRIK